MVEKIFETLQLKSILLVKSFSKYSLVLISKILSNSCFDISSRVKSSTSVLDWLYCKVAYDDIYYKF